MSQWKIASREQWPDDFQGTIFAESFSPGPKTKFFNNENGDWVMVLGGSSLESSNKAISDQLLKLEISWHQIGIVRPADENSGPTDGALESLFQLCDLIAIPGNVRVRTQRVVTCGELSNLTSTEEKADTYQLLQIRPTDANMLTQGAPLDTVVDEDLDAREKWFKDRH